MRTTRIRILAEMGLCVALFAILQYFSVRLPINLFGGSVSLCMVPIIVLALLRGPWVGLACGAFCGCVDLLMEPFIFHPVQVFLDYPLAYALVGVSGAFAPLLRRYAESKKVGLVLGTIAVASCAGVLDRFVSHVISGIVFFGANTPEGQNVLWYSVVYNASYLLPSFVVTLPVVMLTIPLLYATLESDRG